MKKKTLPIDCVDLFCGLGGLTHGLTRGGINVTAGFDIDPECKFPYESNNKAKFVKRDVREVQASEITSHWANGKYSLLAGCAPCQSFSTYSRTGRELRKDNRWDLLSDFGRLIKETHPDFITMENVPQLIHHPIFLEFLKTLNGYHVWWKIIDCDKFGVPQTRKRIVLLASRWAEIALIKPPHINLDETNTVAKAIKHLRPITAGTSDALDPIHRSSALSAINLRRIQASKPGGTWREWDVELQAECHKKKAGETYPSVYGRMEWNAPGPTITTQSFGYGNGRFGHPEQDRAISLREAAILQTFPESYKFLPPGKRPIFTVLGRLIGNAVPVAIGEAIAYSLEVHQQQLDSRT